MSFFNVIGDIGYKLLPLTKGYSTKVDNEDYETLSKYKWHVVLYNGVPYAQRTLHLYYSEDGKRHKKMLKLHRVIMCPPDGLDIDHINRDTLDNRRSNLRICSREQNNYNSRKRSRASVSHPTSKYKGVRYVFILKSDGRRYKRNKPWAASGTKNKKTIHLGYFSNEEDAARIYDKYAKENYGEFARLNFPEKK